MLRPVTTLQCNVQVQDRLSLQRGGRVEEAFPGWWNGTITTRLTRESILFFIIYIHIYSVPGGRYEKRSFQKLRERED